MLTFVCQVIGGVKRILSRLRFHIGIIPMCPYLDFLNEIVFFLHSKHIMPLPCLNQDIPLFFIGGMTSH